MHKHHQHAAQYAKAQMHSFNVGDGKSPPSSPDNKNGGSMLSLKGNSLKSKSSIIEKAYTKNHKEKHQKNAISKGITFKPGQHMLSKTGASHDEYMKHHASVKVASFREASFGENNEYGDNDDENDEENGEDEVGGSMNMGSNSNLSKIALSGQVGSNNNDQSNSILGFPKDCGPRSGVRILSYQRAIHVRNLNHPHLTFERAGSGVDAWYCISEGFFNTTITDCIEVNIWKETIYI